MFKSAELIYPIAFFQMFYNDKPVDWLLEHLIYTKVCNWEKDMVREKETLNKPPLTLNFYIFHILRYNFRSTVNSRRRNYGFTISPRFFSTSA